MPLSSEKSCQALKGLMCFLGFIETHDPHAPSLLWTPLFTRWLGRRVGLGACWLLVLVSLLNHKEEDTLVRKEDVVPQWVHAMVQLQQRLQGASSWMIIYVSLMRQRCSFAKEGVPPPSLCFLGCFMQVCCGTLEEGYKQPIWEYRTIQQHLSN